MRSVWKSELQITDIQRVQIPEGAHILCAREQGDSVCIWYECDVDAPLGWRTIGIRGTGYPLGDDPTKVAYLGTAVTDGGKLVWHVYEVL